MNQCITQADATRVSVSFGIAAVLVLVVGVFLVPQLAQWLREYRHRRSP